MVHIVNERKEFPLPRRRPLSLTKTQRQELLDYRDPDSRPYMRERCAALLKIAEGLSPFRVSQQGLLQPRDPDTIYSWLTIYEEQGVAGLIAHQHGGPRRGFL